MEALKIIKSVGLPYFNAGQFHLTSKILLVPLVVSIEENDTLPGPGLYTVVPFNCAVCFSIEKKQSILPVPIKINRCRGKCAGSFLSKPFFTRNT